MGPLAVKLLCTEIRMWWHHMRLPFAGEGIANVILRDFIIESAYFPCNNHKEKRCYIKVDFRNFIPTLMRVEIRSVIQSASDNTDCGCSFMWMSGLISNE